MPPINYVRVTDAESDLGLELSVPERKVAAYPDRYKPITDEQDNPVAATDRGGSPLEPVYKAAAEGTEDPGAMPAKNAKHEVWIAYATDHGFTAEDAAAKSRDELVAHFTQES